MSFAQQNQTDFERKYSNLTGSLAENYSEEVLSTMMNAKHNGLRIANI